MQPHSPKRVEPKQSLDGSVGIVTGASGFIGRAVIGALPAGCTVYATYNSSSDFAEWALTQQARIIPVQIDLTSERLADHVPTTDWALLMAARVQTVASAADPLGELKAVAGVTANSIVGLRTRQLVHLSSGSVYETLEGELSPARVLSPRLPYSIAKLAAELFFASYAEGDYWIVRFFGAFGPGEPDFKLARRLVETFASGESTFELRGDGRNVIDPMYVDDAAAALLALVASPGESRIADLTQGEGLSVEEFARAAYASVHPDPGSQELQISYTGEAHEQMLGRARTDATVAALIPPRMTIAAGFRWYSKQLGSSQARNGSA